MNNNKTVYIKPNIEILEVELEGMIANSPGSYTLDEGTTYDGGAFSKQRSFWGE